MVTKFVFAGFVLAVLTGCASQPNVYYTLTASDQGPEENARPLPVDLTPGPYTLTSLVVPAPVDDTMLVVRRSDDQLMKLAHDRWTAPLGKQVGNALAVALTRQVGMPPLSRPQATSTGTPVTQISVDVQRFDLVPGQFAAFTAVWQVSSGHATTGPGQSGRRPPLNCYTTLSQSVEPGVAPLVRAQQRNIEQLAHAMVQTWLVGQPPASTRCQ